nr:Jag N-terminal domain-containing protein [uncultured Oscillibacter sp.]
MRDYIDVTGKNEDEAISKALAQLGLDRDDVSVEVLERAKSGFLGLGACPAKIRVYYGPEEEAEILPPPPAPAPAPAPVREEVPRPAAPETKARPERRERPPRE